MSTRQASSTQLSTEPDLTLINLNRLLARLQQNILTNPPAYLRRSSLQRTKAGANVEHARTLLLSLEHSAALLPTKSKKNALQSDLQQKREVMKQLHQRLQEWDQLEDTASGDSSDSDNQAEDIFPSYAPHLEAEDGLEVTVAQDSGTEAFAGAAQNLASHLRRRGGAQEQTPMTTGSSLFPSQTKASSSMSDPARTEAILSHDRAEQENLTTSLLDMAKQLKKQSLHLNQTLESDKSVVDRAVSGLDKNQLGMEAAGQRMGTLRRMTEGQGWFARMKLYAMIFGLWIAAFLIVFVLPKIRF